MDRRGIRKKQLIFSSAVSSAENRSVFLSFYAKTVTSEKRHLSVYDTKAKTKVQQSTTNSLLLYRGSFGEGRGRSYEAGIFWSSQASRNHTTLAVSLKGKLD
ncbi:hypothetical protein P5673_004169 [Acropora cervicornis]|uniref:Uncharacterized protein n=1 Tax=Acropora cervicornis TaxID=6130 RepID=A0AAD9QZV3_ACRCE|nr:hypothetical protein P5673_004169 [Acropora cervicornis]